MDVEDWPDTPPLTTKRLQLEPLRVEHADELAPLLADPVLHAFIGGTPATLGELRDRYARQVVGRSDDGSQRWLNWIVRRREDERTLGTVQATVSEGAGRLTAEVAWVIAAPHQGRGYAREASSAMVAWLRDQAVTTVTAHVHPRHGASMAVARSIGLTATATVVDGEVRWEG